MTIKNGYSVPNNVRQALELDKAAKNDKWKKAIAKEMLAMEKMDVFKLLSKDEKFTRSTHQFAPLHLVFDVKFDGTHKARYVIGGNRVDSSEFSAYASVVKTENIRILLTLAANLTYAQCVAISAMPTSTRIQKNAYGPRQVPNLEKKQAK